MVTLQLENYSLDLLLNLINSNLRIVKSLWRLIKILCTHYFLNNLFFLLSFYSKNTSKQTWMSEVKPNFFYLNVTLILTAVDARAFAKKNNKTNLNPNSKKLLSL